jgi:hypothetical protein
VRCGAPALKFPDSLPIWLPQYLGSLRSLYPFGQLVIINFTGMGNNTYWPDPVRPRPCAPWRGLKFYPRSRPVASDRDGITALGRADGIECSRKPSVLAGILAPTASGVGLQPDHGGYGAEGRPGGWPCVSPGRPPSSGGDRQGYAAFVLYDRICSGRGFASFRGDVLLLCLFRCRRRQCCRAGAASV